MFFSFAFTRTREAGSKVATMSNPKLSKRERQIIGERRSRELRKDRLPDEHPQEVQRRADEAAAIRKENLFAKLLEWPQGSHATNFERRYKSHATVPDNRERFG